MRQCGVEATPFEIDRGAVTEAGMAPAWVVPALKQLTGALIRLHYRCERKVAIALILDLVGCVSTSVMSKPLLNIWKKRLST